MYVWNSKELCNAAIFPKKAGDALKMATFTQLKVLVWIATCGRSDVDAATCSAALGGRITEADCADALAFWEAEGVLVSDKSSNKSTASSAKSPNTVDPESSVAAAVRELTAKMNSSSNESVSTVTETEIPKPSPVVKTLSTEKATPPKRTVSQKEFVELLHTVEARFGKTLSRSDQDRLLDLCEETTLPTEVLIMIVAYTVKNDKKRVSYVQTVARSWEEQGINTIDAADRYLCHLERREKAWKKLADWLSLSIERPTVSQKDLAEKWIYEFKQKQPLLSLAYTKCFEKTGKFQAAYMDRLLCAWHEDGITSPEMVGTTKKAAPRPTKKSENGGFDVEKYEKMIAGSTPRFRKKGQ